MSRYYLHCRSIPAPGTGTAPLVWFYGEIATPSGVRGRAVRLDERQARWFGPRLARCLRCEVTAQRPDPALPTTYRAEARWRYNEETATVETIQEWGEHGCGQEAVCDGVSSVSPAAKR